MLRIILSLMFVSACFIPAHSAQELQPISDNGFSALLGEINVQLKELAVQTRAPSVYLQERELIRLLRDKDPNVRLAALKYARTSSRLNNKDVRRQIMLMAGNSNEFINVRLEALKTLYRVSHYSDIRGFLFEAARKAREPEVRAMAYKALHRQARSRSKVRDTIMALAKQEKDPVVRRAMIWSLFECGSDRDVRNILVNTVKNSKTDTILRAESIKSLYGAMGYSDIRRFMIQIATNENALRELRIPAILTLSNSHSSETKRALERLMRHPDPVIRSTALKAAAGEDSQEMRRYFHLAYKLENGDYINPIENE